MRSSASPLLSAGSSEELVNKETPNPREPIVSEPRTGRARAAARMWRAHTCCA